MTRRDLALLLPALGLLAPPSDGADTGTYHDFAGTHSGVFPFESLPVHRSSGGAETRPVIRGKTPTGEQIELHETTLMPGQMPHPAHRHVHTELMLIREGTVTFLLEGKTEKVSAGGVAYAASGELHGLKNTGTVPAKYFVIAIGSDPKSS